MVIENKSHEQDNLGTVSVVAKTFVELYRPRRRRVQRDYRDSSNIFKMYYNFAVIFHSWTSQVSYFDGRTRYIL